MSFDRKTLLRGLAVASVAFFLVAGAALAAGGIRTSRTVQAGASQPQIVHVQRDESQASGPGQDTNDEQGDAASAQANEQCGHQDADVNDKNNADENNADENNADENNADEQCGDQGQQGASDEQGDQNDQGGGSGTDEASGASAGDNGDQGSASGSGESGSDH